MSLLWMPDAAPHLALRFHLMKRLAAD